MAGSLVDLSQPDVAIPNPIVLDTSVVIAFFQTYFPGEHLQHVARAASFFLRLRAENQQAILTPTAYSELLHIAVRNRYKRAIRGQQRALTARLGAPIKSWTDLFKHDPTILQQFGRNLTLIRQSLVANNVVIAGQEDLDFDRFPPELPHADEVIAWMVRYGLDTSDTLILLEATRLGVTSIVTMDRDIQRAAVDFDIYAWNS